MNSIPDIMIRVYGFLLRLYPIAFRKEFEEQMLLDFLDMAADAKEKGRFSFVLFCLRELIDFPVNLLRVHLKEGRMFKVLRSQPVNYGLRGAVGFSVSSFFAFIISDLVFWKLDASDDSIIGYLQVYFYDLFHAERGLELIAWISPAFGFLLTGLLFGLVLAILFAGQSGYRRYILVGILGWFLHSAVTSILWYSASLGFFLGSVHFFYFSIALDILSGAFLGLTFIIAKSEKSGLIRVLTAGLIAYPLIAYFYVKLLFKLSIIETPWMFIALMFMLVIYIGSVLLMARISESKPKVPWLVIVSAIAYPLIPYFGRFVPRQILPSLNMPAVLYYTDPAYWQYTFVIAIQQAIYMIPFGLLIGVALGFQNKNNSPQITA